MQRISMDQGAAHSLSASMHESSTSRGRSLDAGGPAAAAAEVPTRQASPAPAATSHSMPMHELHAAGHEASSMMLAGPPQADPYHHTPAATFGNHPAGAGPAALSQPYNAHAHRTAPPLGVPPRTAAGRASAAVAGFRPLASSPPDSWAHHPSMGAMLHHAPDHPTPGLELRAPQNPNGPWGGPFTSGGPFNSHGPQQYGQYTQQQQQQARPLGASFHGGRSGSMGGTGTGGQMAAGAGGSASVGGAGMAQDSSAGGTGGGSGGGGGGGGAPRLDARLVVDHPVATRVTQRPDGTIVCEPVEVLMWDGHSRKNGEDSSPRALHHQMGSQAEDEGEQGGLHPLLSRARSLWHHPQFQEVMGISAVVLGAVCGLAGLGGAAITLATAVGGSNPALPLPSLHSGPSTFHSHGVTISFGGTNSSSPSHKQSSSHSNPRSSPSSSSSSSSSRSSRTDPTGSGSRSGSGSASGTGGASAAAGSGGGMGGRSGNRLRMGHVADAGHNAMMCSASVLVALASGVVVAPVVAAVHLTRLLLRPALLVGGVAAGVRWARRVRVGATQLLRKLQSGDLRRQLEALRLIVHRAATSPAFRREWARLHGVEALLAYLSAALAAAQAAAAAAQAASGMAPGASPAFPPLLPPGLFLAPSATTSPGSTFTHSSSSGASFASDLNSGSSYSSSGSSGYSGSGSSGSSGSSRYYGSGSTTATSAESAAAAAVAAVWGVGAASGLLVGSLAGPGPALAVRALGELTRDRAAVDALVACGGIPLLCTAAGTALYGSPTAAAAVGAAVGAAVAAGTTTAGMATGAILAAVGAPASARAGLPGQHLAARFGVAAATEGITGHQLHTSVPHHRPGSPASVKDGSGEETGGEEEGGDSWTVVSPTKIIMDVTQGVAAAGPPAAAAATAATAAAVTAAGAAGAGGEAKGPGGEAKGPGGEAKGPGAAPAAAADACSSVAGEQPSSRASEPAAAHTDPSNNPTTPPRPSKPHPAASASPATTATPSAAAAVAALRSAAVASRAGCVPALVTAVVEVLARSSAQSSEAARMVASLPGCAALAVDLLHCALSATGSTAGGFSAPFDGTAPATTSNVPMAAGSAAVPALALLNAIALQPAGKAAMGAAGGVGVLAYALCTFAPPSARVSLAGPHPCGAGEKKKHGFSSSGGGGKVPGGAHASKHGGAVAAAGGAAAAVETGRTGSSALWEPSLFASAASALHGCVRGDPSNTRALAAQASQPTALHSALARATAALARAHAAGDVWSPAPSSLLSLAPPPSSPSPSAAARRASGRAAAAAAAALGIKKGVFGSSSGKRYVPAGPSSSCLVVGEESEEEEVGGGLPSLRSLAMDVAALAHLVSPGGHFYGL